MNSQQRKALQQIAQWKSMSFPSGSGYRRQVLPTGSHKNVNGFAAVNVTEEYNYGYIVRFFDGKNSSEEVVVPFNRISVGAGVDFGAYYCTRDQALIALR